MKTHRRLLLAVLAFLLPALAHAADGSAEPYRSPFALRAELDVPVLLASTLLWTAPMLIGDELPASGCGPCDRDKVNALDRPVVEFQSGLARDASNVTVIGLPVLATVGSYLGRGDGGMTAVGEDLVLMVEALAVAGALNQVVKHAFARPRPYMYRDDAPGAGEADDDDFRSFYSGHTTSSFAAATAFAYLYGARHPDSDATPWIWAGALSLATISGSLRIAAGKHFFSDVAVGAAMGVLAGIMVPALHRVDKGGSQEGSAQLALGPSTVGFTYAF